MSDVGSLSEEGVDSTNHPRLVNENISRGLEKITSPGPFIVDRQKTCPMYVRLFCRMNGHHRLEEFTRDNLPISDEVTIYTWKDATLKELSDLIKEVNEDSRLMETRFSFHLIYMGLRGEYRSKILGNIANSKAGRDDDKTLEELRFVQGDLIDVAISFGNEVGERAANYGRNRESIDQQERGRMGGRQRSEMIGRKREYTRDRDYRGGSSRGRYAR